jgi:hypothetical protein
MPRPMRVKIFMDSTASAVEGQVNAWLDSLKSATIIKTDTTATAGAGKSGDGAGPAIVVTIWYEPSSN